MVVFIRYKVREPDFAETGDGGRAVVGLNPGRDEAGAESGSK